ncbi:MAG TPA: type II secretion system protein GspN [Myxococcales bacterium]|nr:type II secretion system protein GspN [Myxococcales bacterium]
MAGGLTLAQLKQLATPQRLQTLRRGAVPALAVVSFLLFLLLTFPYEMIGRRMQAEAQRAGADLNIGSIGGHGLFGVRARDVRLRPAPSGPEPAPEFRFDRVDVSPDLFAMLLRRTSFGFRLEGYGGTARGHAALSSDPRLPGLQALRLTSTDLDLKALPLKELTGVDAMGRASLQVDVSSLQPAETAGGSISLNGRQIAVTGGNASGFVLPRAALGDLDVAVTIDRGVAKLDRAQVRGGDLDVEADGTVRLRALLSLSQADLHLRLRPSDRWLNENAFVKSALGLVQNARQSDGSYVFSFSGPLSRLNSRPGR